MDNVLPALNSTAPLTKFEYGVILLGISTSLLSFSSLYFLNNWFLAFGIISSVISFNLVIVLFLVGDSPLENQPQSEDEYKY